MSQTYSFHTSPVTQSEYLAALNSSRYGKSTVRDRRVRRSVRGRQHSLRKGGRA